MLGSKTNMFYDGMIYYMCSITLKQTEVKEIS